jgi:hypothetical protein
MIVDTTNAPRAMMRASLRRTMAIACLSTSVGTPMFASPATAS